MAVCASMLGIQLADLDLRKGLAHFVAKLRWLGASLGRELLGSARGKQREGYSSLRSNDKRCVCQWLLVFRLPECYEIVLSYQCVCDLLAIPTANRVFIRK